MRYLMNAFGYTALAANREVKLFRRNRIDINATAAAIEPHATVDQRENRVIATEADVFSGKKLRAALANNDVARDHHLTAESFDAEPFADAVPAVLNAALSFFVSHCEKLLVDG